MRLLGIKSLIEMKSETGRKRDIDDIEHQIVLMEESDDSPA